MSIILGALTLVGAGAAGNGKAVVILEEPREDMLFVSADTKEDGKYLKSTESILELLLVADSRVCDLKQGIFLTTID